MIVTALLASRLQANLRVGIITMTRFPKEILEDLSRFGVDTQHLMEEGSFRIADWYTCVTGRMPPTPPEDMPASLKVGDLGIIASKEWHAGKGLRPESDPNFIELMVLDNLTRLFSYNEENECVKFLYTTIARTKQDERVGVYGFAKGVLDLRTYHDLESMFDGILDIKTSKVSSERHTLVRVRSFPDTEYTTGWHELKSQAGLASLTPLV